MSNAAPVARRGRDASLEPVCLHGHVNAGALVCGKLLALALGGGRVHGAPGLALQPLPAHAVNELKFLVEPLPELPAPGARSAAPSPILGRPSSLRMVSTSPSR